MVRQNDFFASSLDEGRSPRIAVVVHARARGLQARWLKQVEHLVGPSRLFLTKTPEDVHDAAASLVDSRCEVVFSGGGDGTFARLVDAYRDIPGARLPIFGLLPLGTGNALAHWVCSKAPLTDLALTLRARSTAQLPRRQIPLILLDERLAFCFGGLGYDSLLLHDYNAWQGQLHRRLGRRIGRSLLGYLWALGRHTLPKLRRGHDLLHARITTLGPARALDSQRADGDRPLAAQQVLHDGPLSILAVGTCPFYGYGLTMFPAVPRLPSQMQLRIAHIPPGQVLHHLPALWRGTWQHPQLHDFAVEKIAVQLRAAFPFQAAGEDLGPIQRFVLSLAPKPLELLDFSAQGRQGHHGR